MFHEPEKSCDHSSSSTPSYHFSLDWASLVRTFLHFRSLDKTSKLLSSLDKISLIVQRGADALFSHARHTLNGGADALFSHARHTLKRARSHQRSTGAATALWHKKYPNTISRIVTSLDKMPVKSWLSLRRGYVEPLEIHGINEGPWVRAHEAHMIPLGTYVRSQRSTP